jgi:Divergent InlB B-repeat domain
VTTAALRQHQRSLFYRALARLSFVGLTVVACAVVALVSVPGIGAFSLRDAKAVPEQESQSGPVSSSTVDVSTIGQGTITLSPAGVTNDGRSVTTCGAASGDCNGLTYPDGTQLTLSALPAQGSTFAQWSRFECSAAPTCTLATGDEPIAIVASFNPLTLSVMPSGTGSGTVTASPTGMPCSPPDPFCWRFALGTDVTLTAASAAPTKWLGDCASATTSSCTVHVTGLNEIAVVFGDPTPIVFPAVSVNFDIAFGGTGSGDVDTPAGRCDSACSKGLSFGESLMLVATPDSQSHFDHWDGACATDPNCIVYVGPTTSIRAVFTKNATPSTATGETTPSTAAGETTPSTAAGETTPSTAPGQTTTSAVVGQTTPTAVTNESNPLSLTHISARIERAGKRWTLRLRLTINPAADFAVGVRMRKTGRLLGALTYHLHAGRNVVRLQLVSPPKIGRAEVAAVATAATGRRHSFALAVPLR